MYYLKIPVKKRIRTEIIKNNCSDKIRISGLSIHNDKEITVKYEGKEFILPDHKELIKVAKHGKPGDKLSIYRKTHGRTLYDYENKKKTTVPPKYEVQLTHITNNEEINEFKKQLLK